jgi:hypothetical protein
MLRRICTLHAKELQAPGENVQNPCRQEVYATKTVCSNLHSTLLCSDVAGFAAPMAGRCTGLIPRIVPV